MNTTRKEFIYKSILAAAGITGLPPIKNPEKTDSNGTYSARRPVNTEFNISIFSKHLQWLDYPEMAETAAELGFDGVDLTVRPGGHVLPERVTQDLPRAVKAVRDAGLEIPMISTAVTAANEEHTDATLKTAGKLGIQNYRLGWIPYNKKISIPENLEMFKERLNRLASLNKQYDIKADYQNHSGTSFGASAWDLWYVLKDIDNKWIGCQYDIRHATVEGANSWPLDLELISPYIGTMDIKDFHWVKKEDGWQIKNVPLGEGMVDFNLFFEMLKQFSINAPLSIHYEYPLGGAEHGATSLSTGREKILNGIQKDLKTLRGWIHEFN
ncbi:sugar phosphate isomerase/epimerase family protein [Rhodohalobacter sp. 8-1]|uniref:sugar phosphate isomerase/epimerase family protein n=1 Tax=Rhodohalobacter sp. 8-1 TaxID=3131972 RepID=UPI0030EEFD03